MKTDLIDDRAQNSEQAQSPPAAPRKPALLEQRRALLQPLLSIFDQAIVSGTRFATAVIIGRSCSQDQLGFYYLTLTFTVGMACLQETVITGPFTIFGARRRGREFAEYAGSVWTHQTILTAVGMLFLIGAICVMSIAGGPANIIAGMWVLLGVGPLLLLRGAIRGFAFARLHVGTAIALDATVSLLQLGGLLSLWYVGHVSISRVFAVMGGACLVASLGWFFLAPRSARFVRSRVVKDWTAHWSFIKWSLLSFTIGDTLPLVMPWIVGLAAGTAATGVFGACVTLLGFTNVLVLGTANFLKPKAAKSYSTGGIPALRRVLLAIASVFAVVFGTVFVVVFLTGDWVPVLIYGTSFSGTGMILTALAANVLVGSLGLIARDGLLVLGLSRINFASDIAWFVTTIVAALCLVFPYGTVGAALALLIGTTSSNLLRAATLYLAMRSIGRTGGSPREPGAQSAWSLFSPACDPLHETPEAAR